ncbi:hypothetical protein WM40_14850 [Robbsia andropogonis]|uniref:Uncharacterized protein n=1 Tax=Robbsia andropogonis TaxID=28092 RepID=A0A0F5JYW4_9BURK|nr:hypothetical protein WM40_14850 [Robbsia andropogonis]
MLVTKANGMPYVASSRAVSSHRINGSDERRSGVQRWTGKVWQEWAAREETAHGSRRLALSHHVDVSVLATRADTLRHFSYIV